LFDPRLRWDVWAWTQNVSLGDEAQVIVGGNLTYAFSEALNVQALYMDRSAVGYTAIPYAVGGDGWVWTVDIGYWF
jgi:hypothetical protein